VPFFIVTHRPQDAPADAGFTFVDGLDEAIARAREVAGSKDVFVMGGADVGLLQVGVLGSRLALSGL